MNEKLDTALENTLAMIRANAKPDDMAKLAHAAFELLQAKQLLVALMKKQTNA